MMHKSPKSVYITGGAECLRSVPAVPHSTSVEPIIRLVSHGLAPLPSRPTSSAVQGHVHLLTKSTCRKRSAPENQLGGSKYKGLLEVSSLQPSEALRGANPLPGLAWSPIGSDRSDRPGAGAARKVGIVWFRNDLRLHDNEALSTANKECTSIIPLFCFDPREFGQGGNGAETARAGPYRATFLVDCVRDLRERLHELGSDLVVRIGRPEEVIKELLAKVKGSAVYWHAEVTPGEAAVEGGVKSVVESEGARWHAFWANTLYHIDDLPFRLEDMPTNYSAFRERLSPLAVRSALEVPNQLRGLPVGSGVEAGEIPTASQLGVSPAALAHCASDKHAAAAGLRGGETEGLRRLKGFVEEAAAWSPSTGMHGSRNKAFGSNFSARIAPWLAMGCLSPRRMHAEVVAHSASSPQAALGTHNGQPVGVSWLGFELLWRDFFRFMSKRFTNLPMGDQATAKGSLAALSPQQVTPSMQQLALA